MSRYRPTKAELAERAEAANRLRESGANPAGAPFVAPFTRILNPAFVKAWSRNGREITVPVYVKVEITVNPKTSLPNGQPCAPYNQVHLSISGVEGPTRNGHCYGGCGQIVDSLRNPQYQLDDRTPDRHCCVNQAEGWTPELVTRLREIWERWHLNDMRAGCAHQRAENWHVCPGHYHEKGPWLGSAKHGVRPDAMPKGWRLEVLDNGVYVERRLYVTVTNCAGQEEEHRGEEWQSSTRCSLDRLSQPCPTCGYKFGSAWLYEEVPAEVLADLLAFPVAQTRPTWV